VTDTGTPQTEPPGPGPRPTVPQRSPHAHAHHSHTEHGAAMDGNVLAGRLGEVFAVDVTAAVVTCVWCTREQHVGELAVYDTGMGATARCRGCGSVVLRMTRIRSDVVLDLHGARTLRIPVPPGPESEA
jgi:hypothetical protein